MPFLVTLALKLLGLFGGANAGSLITGVTDVLKNKTNADVTKTVSANEQGTALGLGYFDAVNKANDAKARNRPIWMVIYGLLAFATPTAIVYWAALLDGMPWFGHIVGSWKIAIPPELKDTFDKIIDSFFISAPVVGAGLALASVFRK